MHLFSKCLGETLQSKLGCAIKGTARYRHEANEAGDVDDDAADGTVLWVLLAHDPDGMPGQLHGAPEVDVELLTLLFGTALLGIAVERLAGVVDKNIDASKLCQRSRHRGVPGLL